MEQSPSWEANRFSASQELPSILWYPNDHCRVDRTRHLYLVLSHIKVYYWLNSPGFEFRQRQESLLPPNRPDRLWGTSSLIFKWHWGPFPGIKRQGCKADHSPPSSFDVKNEWIYSSTLHVQYLFMAWAGTTLPFVHLFRLPKVTPSPDFFLIWSQLKKWRLVPAILGNLHSPSQ
jgi:hypothetical protein